MWRTEAPFLAVALLVAVLVPAERAFSPVAAGALLAAFVVADAIRLPIRGVYDAPPVQVVFVPMLLLLPLNVVPALVAAGCVLGHLVAAARGQARLGRLPLAFGNGWFSLGPVLVLALAGEVEPQLEDWPVYAAAFAAQLACDQAALWARVLLQGDQPPVGGISGELVWVGGVDFFFSIVGLVVALDLHDDVERGVLPLVAVLALTALAAHERRVRLRREQQALHDPLTGLANRTLLHELLSRAVAQAHRAGTEGAVLLLDLDRFKQVNDTFGHHCGDRLLQHVADRLRQALRASDVPARLGGDEFAVLVPPGAGSEEPEVLADRLTELIGRPYDLDARQVEIGVSIGLARFPPDGHDPLELLVRADESMYRTKARRRASGVL